MIHIFNREKKLMKKLDLKEELSFKFGKVSISIGIEYFFKIITTQKHRKRFITADIINALVVEYLAEFSNAEENKVFLLSEYQRLLESGEFSIWNNALFYYEYESTALEEIAAYISDKFISKNPKFASMKVRDIVDYFEKKKSWKEIEKIDIQTNLFRQRLRLGQINDVISFMDDLVESIDLGIILEKNDNYEYYDFEKDFHTNIKEAIFNYEEIKTALRSSNLDIYITPKEKKSRVVNIGKYLDFKSISWNAIYLNIPNLDSKYSVTLTKETDKYKLFIMNTETKERAEKTIYKKVVDSLN